MKAPKIMVDAVRKVPLKERTAAKLVAEKTYFKHLEKNRQDGEFDEATCSEYAALAAAAEVIYMFS